MQIFQCIIEKIDGCNNNPENTSAVKVSEHIHQVFQCLQYHQSIAQKINMIYREEKIA